MKQRAQKYSFGFILAALTGVLALCGCASDRYAQNDDAAVAARVKHALACNTLYGFYGVDVTCREGTAYLTGYVPHWQQQQTAGDVAKFVPGVQRVQNDILLRN